MIYNRGNMSLWNISIMDHFELKLGTVDRDLERSTGKIIRVTSSSRR